MRGGVRMPGRGWLVVAALSGGGCSTLAEAGGGNDNLPNAVAGPFREIKNDELGAGRAAPYAFRDDGDFPRDAAVVDVDGDPSTLETWAFLAHSVFAEGDDPDASLDANEIIRQVALDGRSFGRAFDVVLTASELWEMGVVAQPAALRRGGRLLLYYRGVGGIGLATSDDGLSFERASLEPVLGPVGGWEQDVAPQSPSVMARADGSLVMFYEVPLASGSAIGEATSQDGVSWSRVGAAPVLTPRAGDIDALGAGSPAGILAASSEGRLIEYLYYGAVDDDGKRTIGMAARYVGATRFQYATSPVFGSAGSLAPTEPMVVRYPDYALLFVTEKAGTTAALDYPAVAVGVAPADIQLAPPDPP